MKSLLVEIIVLPNQTILLLYQGTGNRSKLPCVMVHVLTLIRADFLGVHFSFFFLGGGGGVGVWG